MTFQAPSQDRLWTTSFTLWWLGNAQSALGSALAGIALAYLVLELSGSSGQLGINLALTLLPTLASPLIGTLVDRLSVRLPLIVLNMLRALLQLTVGSMAFRHQISIEGLHLAALVNGVIGACYVPATMGVTPRLVLVTQRVRAVGLIQGSTQTMQLLGLVSGGVLVTQIGSGPSLMLDGLTSLLFSLLLWFVRFPPRDVIPVRASFKSELISGFGYLKSHVILVLLPVLAFCINAALAPLEMLLPARMQALGAGPAGFGFFLGCLSGGMAAASLALAWLGERVRFQSAGSLGLVLAGALFLGLAQTTTPVQMYVLAVWCGAALAILNLSLSLAFQTLVHPNYYGRVGSLLNSFGSLGIPVTLLILAPASDRVSLSLVLMIVGLVFLGSALLWKTVMRSTPGITISPPV